MGRSLKRSRTMDLKAVKVGIEARSDDEGNGGERMKEGGLLDEAICGGRAGAGSGSSGGTEGAGGSITEVEVGKLEDGCMAAPPGPSLSNASITLSSNPFTSLLRLHGSTPI